MKPLPQKNTQKKQQNPLSFMGIYLCLIQGKSCELCFSFWNFSFTSLLWPVCHLAWV